MPELPEVENIVRELRRKIVGKTIKAIEVAHPKVIRPLSPRIFKRELIGGKIQAVTRRGKLIIIELRGNKYLLIHLKMTGQLVLNQKNPNQHTHVKFYFQGGGELHYNDVRRFGFLQLTDKPGLDQIIAFRFGPEPLTEAFKGKILAEAFKNRRSAVKSLLLNQTILAGVGNIYADESLFRAKILPNRPANSLGPQEISRLYLYIKEVLRQAIAAGGSSSSNYVRTTGRKGTFQNLHNVYARTGRPCRVCQTPISRIIIAGRSTHFCPKCQK